MLDYRKSVSRFSFLVGNGRLKRRASQSVAPSPQSPLRAHDSRFIDDIHTARGNNHDARIGNGITLGSILRKIVPDDGEIRDADTGGNDGAADTAVPSNIAVG